MTLKRFGSLALTRSTDIIFEVITVSSKNLPPIGSIDNVVRLIRPRSDNLTFWPKVAKTGQILTKKGPKSQIF